MNGDMEPPEGTIVPIADFVPLEVLRQQELSRYIEDIATLEYRPPILERRLSEGMHSLITVSLIAETELIGELNLFANQPAAFNQEDKEIAYEVADQLAIAIQQARLREQLQSYATKLEQRVAERTAALQEANTELEAFTYSVSHDLRAPLRAMQGFAQALLEDYPDRLDALGQDYAQRIVSAASRMDTLINELLAYSRLSRTELRLQPLSLTTAVEEALAQAEAEIQEKHALVRVEEPLLDVIGHRITLVQVVANLLANAIKFVAPGIQPQVRIWTEEVSRAGGERDNYELQIMNYELPKVRLWIGDNGIGIAPEHQQRIFRVFERLHGVDSYPGTGIGLAIARKGVERMGGRVGVESQPGQGSRFWIELPKALTDC
jgi:signal transduction histidine kinase